MSDKKYLLSDKTAKGLKQLLSDSDGGMQGPNKGKFVNRVTGFVACGSEISSGKYNGTIQVWDVAGESWDTGDSCILHVPNGGKLAVGDKYMAVRYGINSSAVSVWVAAFELKCIEVVVDVECVEGELEITKECLWYLGSIKEYEGEDVCCEEE